MALPPPLPEGEITESGCRAGPMPMLADDTVSMKLDNRGKNDSANAAKRLNPPPDAK